MPKKLKKKTVKEKLNDPGQPLIEHFRELKKRLYICSVVFLFSFIICYFYSKNIYQFLVHPLALALNDDTSRKLIFTGLTEAFFTYVKLALWAAFIVSFPVIAFQLYRFLSPGLYKKEKKAFLPFLIAAPILFLSGAAFVYYFVFPSAWKFFLSFEDVPATGGLPIMLEAKVSEYLALVMHLIFAFGLAFQTPVILCLLCLAGFITAADLRKKRRHAIVAIFIIAGVITPPDILSQVALALPMLLLYESSIIICKRIEKKNA